MNDITSHIHQCRTNDTVQYDCTTHLTHVVLTEICSVPVRRRAGKSVYKLTYFVSSRILNLNSINQLAKQEAFEKCWTHSPQRAASRQFTRCRHCTVARGPRIDVHDANDDNA